ncbi:hypothetical protein SDC9_177444 [bioreactor metagenome]|uniref:Uncharacterized protein n=1 Tax=bioreactor metagenome TaxID=1076179 RepID=A0A645GSV2_9ZZZZ
MADTGIARQLADGAPVACADDENVSDAGIDRHRHMSDHIMVNKFVLLGHHQKAVEYQNTAEFVGIEYVDALELALTACKLFIDFDGKPDIVGMLLRVP